MAKELVTHHPVIVAEPENTHQVHNIDMVITSIRDPLASLEKIHSDSTDVSLD